MTCKDDAEIAALNTEITRLNKMVSALMDRAERTDAGLQSGFNLFQSTIVLENQVRDRTRDLETALRENERITRDLERANHRMEREIEERLRAEAGLRLAATVFESTQDGVVVTDRDGRIIAANPAFTLISEYSAAELAGTALRTLAARGQGTAVSDDIWRIIEAQGSWQGEVWDRRRSGEAFLAWLSINTVKDGDGRVGNYIAVVSDITRVRHADRMEHLAHHDSLTDLPNRRLLLSRLAQAIERARRHGTRGAVLFLDLDRFKNVNDSLGHAAGDELIRQVAARLQEHLRRVDTLARLGGDEFVVVLEELADPEQAAQVAQGLVDRLRQPFLLAGGQEIYIGATVGIGLFPDDGTVPGKLLQRADTALYQAKERGRGGYRFYTEAMTRAATRRVRLESALRRAIERDEFVLHYQPLVSVADNRVKGVEALVRWQSPEHGPVGPAHFVPVAEETGLILPLGEWVLREACRCMERWLAAGLAIGTMAVNLSPRQFSHPGLQRQIESILEETALPRDRLELELTESALIETGNDAVARLGGLKSLGVRLAIDDFGTGYSSLAYLRHFPIDKLKVDKSFVQDIPGGQAGMQIAAAVVALAKNLRLEVLAEGVETPAQLGFIARHACDTCQGYLFSPPLPEAALEQWLAARADGGGC